MLLHSQHNYREVSLKLNHVENALKVAKEHSAWLSNLRSSTERRFFELFDKNRVIQEALEKVKNENFLLNMELAELRLFVPEGTLVPNSTSFDFEN